VSRRGRKTSEPRVILTERALSDLREIETYSVREWGRKTADLYLDDLQAALDRLQEDPNVLHLEPDLSPGLYFYRVRKHFLVCDDADGVIVILTVIHTSMDIPSRLAELEPRLAAEVKLLRNKARGETKRK